MAANQTVLRINTHRAGRNLRIALGYRPQYYYTLEHGGCFVVLDTDVADRILPIKGITKTRTKLDALGKCW